MSQLPKGGRVTKPFVETLFNHFLPTAVAGDAESQFELAELWYYVVGLPDIAFDWYRRAAAAGHAKSAHRLSRMYLAGLGTEDNAGKAMLWGLIAVSLGEADSVSVVKSARRVLTRDEIVDVLQHFRDWRESSGGRLRA